MATSRTARLTDFTMDIHGRYIRSGFDEAVHSAYRNAQRPDADCREDGRSASRSNFSLEPAAEQAHRRVTGIFSDTILN